MLFSRSFLTRAKLYWSQFYVYKNLLLKHSDSFSFDLGTKTGPFVTKNKMQISIVEDNIGDHIVNIQT